MLKNSAKLKEIILNSMQLICKTSYLVNLSGFLKKAFYITVKKLPCVIELT